MQPQSHLTFSKAAFIKVEEGKVTAKYKLVKQIGRGISGVVYQACQRNDLKNVKAIKTVTKTEQNQQTGALLNELQILSEVDHPDIIKLYQTYQDSSRFYYVTESFCEGGELFDFLEMKGCLSEEEARHIFNQMLGAIKYCHSLKIAHRDLKPENFLLMKKPGKEIDSLNLKLIDFGLAYKWKSSMKAEIDALKKKRLVGTAYYIAPQIIEGSYDERCDIWSLGVILYILVTGVPPFDGQNDKEILKSIQKKNVSFIIPEMTNVSMLLKDLLRKMLQPAISRISINEIYEHPWMKMKLNRIPLQVDFKIMASFSKFSKIKAIAATYLASQMTAKETENMSKLFRTLDENHDGFLSVEELDTYLYKNKNALNYETYTQLKNLAAFIESASTGGKINYTQFLSSTISEQVISSEQNLKKVFSMLDRDGNGYIDREQLRSILSKHGLLNNEEAEKSINQIFDSTDENRDGKIDFSEFVAAITKI